MEAWRVTSGDEKHAFESLILTSSSHSSSISRIARIEPPLDREDSGLTGEFMLISAFSFFFACWILPCVLIVSVGESHRHIDNAFRTRFGLGSLLAMISQSNYQSVCPLFVVLFGFFFLSSCLAVSFCVWSACVSVFVCEICLQLDMGR